MMSKNRHSLPTSITICNAQIPFKQSLKNLGLMLDCHLTVNVFNIAQTCYFELCRVASNCRFMANKDTVAFVSAFVLSKIYKTKAVNRFCVFSIPVLPSYPSTTSPKNCGMDENLWTTTCHKTVVGISKGNACCRIRLLQQSLFLCQSNVMEIMRLLQR